MHVYDWSIIYRIIGNGGISLIDWKFKGRQSLRYWALSREINSYAYTRYCTQKESLIIKNKYTL